MGAATAQTITSATHRRGLLRADERALVVPAGAVFALASGGAAMAAAVADAMFLAEVGRDALGGALAISSALLAVVLAVVGGLADRLERRRVLGDALRSSRRSCSPGSPRCTRSRRPRSGATPYIGGKQLAAATDLAFWVVIAERHRRARRSQRLSRCRGGGRRRAPRSARCSSCRSRRSSARRACSPAPPCCSRSPARGRAAADGRRSEAARPRRRGPARRGRSRRGSARSSYGRGATARAPCARYPLARHLAVVVAAAGVFASLAYFALGVRRRRARRATRATSRRLLGAVRGARADR